MRTIRYSKTIGYKIKKIAVSMFLGAALFLSLRAGADSYALGKDRTGTDKCKRHKASAGSALAHPVPQRLKRFQHLQGRVWTIRPHRVIWGS